MTAGQLFQAGKLDQAVQALGAELRDNPGDVQRRTFLFELLCFAGAYDRAEKHLDVLAQGGKDAQLGALLYAGALHAERTRTELFQKREYPKPAGESTAAPLSGTLNGQPVRILRGCRSADRRQTGSLRRRAIHVAAAGTYRLDRNGGAETIAGSAVVARPGPHGSGVQGAGTGRSADAGADAACLPERG